MVKSPVVFEAFDCLGTLRGKPLKSSSLNASSTVLVSFGADEILVPVPNEKARESFTRSREQLPTQRRALVKAVDTNGRLYAQIREFLRPLHEQAKKWPEDAFVNFSVPALYKIAPGKKLGASVCSSGLDTVLGFIPLVDKKIFAGEARYRFSELSSILTSFDAYPMKRAMLVKETLDEEKSQRLIDIIESAEFKRVTERMGRLGYVANPRVGLMRLEAAIRNLVSSKRFRGLVKMGTSASELPGSPLNLSTLDGILRIPNETKSLGVPNIDLPLRLEYSIFKESLRAVDQKATTLSGTILTLEFPATGFHSWLNEGEEWKMDYNRNLEMKMKKNLIKNARKSLLIP